MGKKEAKTNAIRILETMKIPYEARTYECDDFVDAAQIADKLGLDPEMGQCGFIRKFTAIGKKTKDATFQLIFQKFSPAAKASGKSQKAVEHFL